MFRRPIRLWRSGGLEGMGERRGDCLIVGSGVGGLALGTLLAEVGVRVTVLEAHPYLDWRARPHHP